MPKDVERCVKDIRGTNKRTGKPYTDQEKWAICQAMHKRKGKSEFSFSDFTEGEVDEVTKDVEDSMDTCMQKMMKSGKAKNQEEARALCEALMSKAEYDLEKLEFILTKIL